MRCKTEKITACARVISITVLAFVKGILWTYENIVKGLLINGSKGSKKAVFFKFGELRERSILLNNKNDKKNIVFFFSLHLYHTEDAQFHCDIILRFFYFLISEGYLEDGGHD